MIDTLEATPAALASATAPAASARRAPSAPRQPRLGFAGVGWIGRNRLDAIAAQADVTIAAVADPVADAVERTLADYPTAERVDAFEQLLDLDLDGIVIATPSALHASQAIAALERGIAVFCQKPLARTASETRAVVAAARSANRLLGIDLSYRYTAGMGAIRELVRSGELGEIYAIESVFHNAYGPDKPWFYDPAASGGGCLLDLGIHLVDLGLWCLDFPAVRRARGVLRNHEQTGFLTGSRVEDYATGQLELEGGTAMQVTCSWRAPAGCDARIEVSFFGTRGGAVFRNVNGSFYDFEALHCLPDRTQRVLARPPEAWGGRAAVAWAEQLGRSRAFDLSAQHSVQVAEALDRLYGR